MAKNHPHEGNLYDKIFKENAESIFIPLVEAQLGIKIKKFRHLKEKMQITCHPAIKRSGAGSSPLGCISQLPC